MPPRADPLQVTAGIVGNLKLEHRRESFPR
jgi:hypothetical protein